MDILVQEVSHVYRHRGGEKLALDRVSLVIREGTFFGIVGPNGCGKTTLLHILAQILEPTSGRVEFVGERRCETLTAMVFQNYALLPWRVVTGNVALGPEVRGKPRPIYRKIAAYFTQLVRLRGMERAYPYQLSGGMKQRTGIGRALANNPEVLLLDEPFAQLDPQVRVLMRQELEALWAKERKTFVYVTHHLEEAVLLCDRVAVFSASPGHVEEVIEIPFPRPRSFDTMGDPAFARIVKQIWERLAAEAERAMREAPPEPPRRRFSAWEGL